MTVLVVRPILFLRSVPHPPALETDMHLQHFPPHPTKPTTTQGLRVTRNRDPVQDVLASEDPDLGGLGADAGVTVLRAAAAGSHACCLLSNLRLHLMALDDGDLMPVGSVEEAGEEGEGGGGVWEEVEAVCMFGVQVRFCDAWWVWFSLLARQEGNIWSRLMPALEGVVSAGGGLPEMFREFMDLLPAKMWHIYTQDEL